jgi:hypothetical protein
LRPTTNQDAQKNDAITGADLGFVDVFTADGVPTGRPASAGTLTGPWGVARQPGEFSLDILIGNFGAQGKVRRSIKSVDGGNNNRFFDPLQDADRQPLSVVAVVDRVSPRFATRTPISPISLQGRTSSKKRGVRQDRGKTQD